jgi:AsmA-like protein
MRRKLLVAAVAVLGLLAVLGLVLTTVEFESPRLGQAVLERAGTLAGGKVTAQRFGLSLLRGLKLTGVEASSTLAGGRYELSMDELVFRHRLLPLFGGRISVERVLLERPRLRLVSKGGTAARAAPAPAAAVLPAGLSLHVSEVDVRHGTIELRSPELPSPVTVSGVDLRLEELALDPARGKSLGGLSGRGRLSVDGIAFARTRVRDAEGRMRIADGRLETEGVRFTTDEGRFEARLVMRLDRLPLAYSLALTGDPLDLNAASGAGRGGGFGPALLDLKAEGVGTESTGLNGRGLLKLEAGSLPATPALKAIEALLGPTRLVGARYRATQSPFRLERGRVLFDGFRLDSDQVGLVAGGSISLAGPLDLAVAVRTPRQGLALGGVSADVLDALTDEAGFVRVPLRVTGTQEHPHVAPDLGALAAQAREGGTKVLARKAGEKLKGLLK